MSEPGMVRRQASRQLRVVLEHFPATHIRFYRWRARRSGRGGGYTPLRPNTQLALVAYPGSGNSFFRVAFTTVNPGVELASHMHSSVVAAAAVSRGLPLVMLVRDPADAVASQLARFPNDGPIPWALADYARLYKRCLRYLDVSVVATFSAATSRPGAITAAVNKRFGASFATFPDDDESAVAEALSYMQRNSAQTFGADASLRGSMPSEARTAAKQLLLAEIESAKHATALRRCRAAAAPFFEAAAAGGL